MALRVATLNIWNRMGDWDARLSVLRNQLGRLLPDVLGLQEVLQLEYEGTSFDQSAAIAAGYGYHVLYGRHPDSPHPMGNAILSKWPFRRTLVRPLPRAGTDEFRTVVLASIEAPFGNFVFACTHLNWKLDEGHVREEQIDFVVRELDSFSRESNFPAVLVGDLNADPDADEIRFLRGLTTLGGRRTYFSDAFLLSGSGEGATYARSNPYAAPLREPNRRIDYILSRGPDGEGRGEPLTAEIAFDASEKGVYASDHYGLLATLRV